MMPEFADELAAGTLDLLTEGRVQIYYRVGNDLVLLSDVSGTEEQIQAARRAAAEMSALARKAGGWARALDLASWDDTVHVVDIDSVAALIPDPVADRTLDVDIVDFPVGCDVDTITCDAVDDRQSGVIRAAPQSLDLVLNPGEPVHGPGIVQSRVLKDGLNCRLRKL